MLNQIADNTLSDIASLTAQVRDTTRRQQELAILVDATATGLQAITAYLQTLLPAAPANVGLADFYGTEFIAAANTATIDSTYGQATLPVLTVQEMMSGTTATGDVWVPDDARLRWMIGTS